jgi:type I restriction enzyme S subunit
MLFDNYDLLMDSPNSTVKMRKLILQLAVQGKLVVQDPTDEPASELLKRIKAEKEKLIAEGKIKKQKTLPPINKDEIPYELPDGWGWVRLGELGLTQTGSTPPTSKREYYGNDYVFIKPADISGQGVRYNRGEGLSKKGIEKGRLIKAYSVLMVCIGGSIGKVNFVDRDCSCNQQINAITPSNDVDFRIVNYNLASPYFQNQVLTNAPSTTLPILSKGKWDNIPFPLPPVAEQNRIVAKVDQLMHLCDQLDACQKKASTKYESFNDAALGKLLSSKTIDEFAGHWQFICNNFDLIYNDPAHVNKLRQAILQLAVQGKLAPQDPNDQPASELLKRIKAEKEKLITEGKIKKQKLLPPINEDEIPYELPEGWAWVRLGKLTQVITKGSSPKWQGIQYVGSDEGLLFLTSKNVGNYNLILDNSSFVEWKFNEIEPRSILQNGDILMNIVGASIGRTALYDLDEIANINQAVCLIRFLNFFSFDKRYFLHFFNSPVCISYMFDKQVDMARPKKVLFTFL